MAQHFLLSAKARTLSVIEIARMSDEEAREAFRAVRFAQNNGEPFCPECGCVAVYEYESRPIFKCKGCEQQFSLTSGTIFADRKLAMRDILAAIAIFVNGANGHAALRLSRDLGVSYKTAFVLAHKLREVVSALQSDVPLTGLVDIDGTEVGGHIKKANLVKERRDLRGIGRKKQIIVTMKERRSGGRSRSFVYKHESHATPDILRHVSPKAKVRTDEAAHWNVLRAFFDDVKSVNHSVGYVINGVHTNAVEGHNSRIKRGIRGVHHRISGGRLQRYADEYCWREDRRRSDNGAQFNEVLRASSIQPVSTEWKGYWRKRPKQKQGDVQV